MPIATAHQTIGPYWHLIEDKDLVRPDPLRRGRVTGSRHRHRVSDGAGTPVADAAIEIWQTDPPASDSFRLLAAPHRRHGMFRFITLKPGPVAGVGNAQQAPHLAVSIFARGLLKALTTRLYFQDEPLNETDPVLSLIEDRAAAAP